MPRFTRRTALGAAAATLAAPRIAMSQTTTLKVMVFPGVGNLPLFIGQSQGFFTRRGLSVEILNTPNSTELRNGLAQGRHQLVVAGVDNGVAMAEAGQDMAILMGGDSGFNSFHVKPEIRDWADMRGRTLIVDAPDTAFALVAYKMLALNGLPRGSYNIRPTGGTFARYELMLRDPDAHGSMLNLPFSLQAVDQGVRNLANATDVVGPYLGFASFAMRDWARANADVVQRYLAAYVESIRFMLNPANADTAAGLLTERLRLSPEMARRNLAIVTDPRGGAAVDGRFDMEGFRNVLRIRAEMLGSWGGTPPAPERYLDLSHWERAVASL